MGEKIYVGTGKKTKFDGQVNQTICLSDIPKEWIYEYNGKKYVNITCSMKKDADQYGKTHYIEINQFKPDQKSTISNLPIKSQVQETGTADDDLPF